MELCIQFLKEGFKTRSEKDVKNEIVIYFKTRELTCHLNEQEEKQIENFVYKWATKWRECSYRWETFSTKHLSWLNKKAFKIIPRIDNTETPQAGPSKRKCFSDLSKSQQNRQTKGKILFIKNVLFT